MYNVEHILEKPALYDQLAEEAIELAHAAMKYSRALRGDNPIRVSDDEAYAKIVEEYTDVIQSARILGLVVDEDQIVEKHKRWVDALIKHVTIDMGGTINDAKY